MDTKAHYTLVGLCVVLLGAALVTCILWLSVGLDRPTYHTFLIDMHQSVTGLNTEAPVKFNGVTVGYVKSMELNVNNPQEVIVDVDIRDGTPITTSTVATLAPQGVTGIVFVSLSANTPNAPLVKVKDEPPYPIIPSEPSILVQLSSLLKDASSQVQGMSSSVQSMLDAQNAANFKQLLINLNAITQNIANNTTVLNQVLTETEMTMRNTAVSSQQFPILMTSLTASVQNLNEATSLAKQGMIPAVQFMNRLDTIAGNVEAFSYDVKQNPAVLVRGKQPGRAGPGE